MRTLLEAAGKHIMPVGFISNTMYTDPSFSDRTIPTAFSFSLLTIYIKSANRQQERETHNHNTYHTVDIAGGPPWHE